MITMLTMHSRREVQIDEDVIFALVNDYCTKPSEKTKVMPFVEKCIDLKRGLLELVRAEAEATKRRWEDVQTDLDRQIEEGNFDPQEEAREKQRGDGLLPPYPGPAQPRRPRKSIEVSATDWQPESHEPPPANTVPYRRSEESS